VASVLLSARSCALRGSVTGRAVCLSALLLIGLLVTSDAQLR
jgi:hypothetical protein